MKGKRIAKEKEKEVVDGMTGEVVEVSKEVDYVYRDKEPNYIKLYLDGVGKLSGLAVSNNAVLYELLKKMEFETNLIYVNSYMKTEIAKDCKVSISAVNNSISKFVKKRLLVRVGTGTYRANPLVFGSGSWDNIKSIRLSLEYNNDGMKISSEFEKFGMDEPRIQKSKEDDNQLDMFPGS